ncbi:efflux RND transporter permease subunit [Marinobacter sp. AL4B]|uniref:efflux RND transporter permease subunit n=1 Tax=Marinobacter sp. AL4B TaxID=2871173 RepID=UPI001CAA62D5|nr:MMPL family transporter [Marinobacter sp. AL4B]MBZ0333003.1 MMPL family transporter [Marinobacter sp. AL4B]
MIDQVARSLSEFSVRHRVGVAIVIFVSTALMALNLIKIDVRTVFSDMVPSNHEYVDVHETYKETFGGSNKVSILVQAREGDIMTLPILEEIQRVTRELAKVSGVNPFQVVSLASRKLKSVSASSMGIESVPLMWPEVPTTEAGIESLRDAIVNNPLVYGIYVEPNLSSTLIQMDFYDHLVDYSRIFPQIQAILDASPIADQVTHHVVGEPILYGWVNHFLDETVTIALVSLGAMLLALFLLNRTWRGTLLPLLSGVVSAIWALSIGVLLGFNFDPLVIVVAFIITARCFSHAVQLITRFDDLCEGEDISPRKSAEQTMKELFRPGLLGLVSDAGAILCVLLTPIPLIQKVSIIGAIWVVTIGFSAVILTPVMLSWVKAPLRNAHSLNLRFLLTAVLALAVRVVETRARFFVLPVTLLAVGLLVFKATELTIGDATTGSPVLWEESAFNRDSVRINASYPGTDQMFVVLEAEENDALKRPDVLSWMQGFQRRMERLPQVGGSVSLADIVLDVRRNLYEGNPRYSELGATQLENGELISFYMQGAAPDDLAQFADPLFRNGSVILFFRDRQGETLRQATYQIRKYIDEHPLQGVNVRLAGGSLGIIAAVNEILLSDQIEAIALALLVVILSCLAVYRSSASGVFFIVPVLISNVVTFAFMAWQGIGMSISTLPVVALGIGLGVDYAFYIVDSVKEYLERYPESEPMEAIRQSLFSAGRGVLLTSVTLAAGVLFWSLSSLRFQAEMGTLIGLWLLVAAFTSLFVMPSLIRVLKPKFIFGDSIKTAESDRKTERLAQSTQ